MKGFVLACIGWTTFFLLSGCSNSGTKAYDVKREINEMKQRLAVMAAEQNELRRTIDELKTQSASEKDDLATLREAIEQIRKSPSLNEGPYPELRKSIDRLQESYDKLSNKVAESLASTRNKVLDDDRGGLARRSVGDTRDASNMGNRRGGAEFKRPGAEVCEAIDEYLRQIASAMRSGQNSRTGNKMDTALAQLKVVLNRFKDQKDSAKITLLAEELKWKADNASKSRSYLMENRKWLQRFNEDRTALSSFCGGE